MAEAAYSNEIWRVIEEAPHYAVSSLGRVKRVVPDKLNRPMHILRTPLNDKGYPCCSLHVNGKQLHRAIHSLVCTAFHGPKPTPKHEVRHLDGNPLNPRLDNLAWGTSKDNKADQDVHGTVMLGSKNHLTKLSDADVIAIRASNDYYRDVAERFSISANYVHRIRRSEARPRLAEGH